MIDARYDEDGNIILNLKLIGTCGDKKAQVLMDTGFSGALAIPVSIGCEIGLEGVGDAQVIVASGEVVPVPIFLGKIEIGDEIIECIYIVLAGSTEVLIGMEILKGYSVSFFGDKKAISVNKAEAIEKVEAIEPSVVVAPPPPPEAPIPIPQPPSQPLAESTPAPSDRMQTLKETLREVVPR